jgi:hypothetical protein
VGGTPTLLELRLCQPRVTGTADLKTVGLTGCIKGEYSDYFCLLSFSKPTPWKKPTSPPKNLMK